MDRHFFLRVCIFFASIMIISACSGGDMGNSKTTYDSLNNVPANEWEKLSEQIIYFGHQSVGNNILDGVKDLMNTNANIHLNISELKEKNDFKHSGLYHSRVGANSDYDLKINAFLEVLDSGIGKKAKIVGLKFCYLDIAGKSDISKMFETYQAAIKTIHTKYPKLKIIHFTAPLTVSKTTWKTRLKKLLGKTDLWEYNDNIKRNEYNKLLIEAYQGQEPVVNIAQIESTKPDGSRHTFELKEVTYFSLAPDYTYDGGHLNEVGRKRVAEQFLLTLVNQI